MTEQLTLFSGGTADIDERSAYALLFPIFNTYLEECNISPEALAFDRKKNYSSITLTSMLVARLCFRGQNSYVEVPVSCADAIPPLLSRTKTKDGNFIQINIAPASSISTYVEFWEHVISSAIDRIPKEYDCCHQYAECSDAGRCISENKELGIGCGYKKVLRSGRIFFGKNRNID